MNFYIVLRTEFLLILFALLTACVDDKPVNITNNGISNNKQVVERLITAINERNTTELDSLVTDGFVNHSATGKGFGHGLP